MYSLSDLQNLSQVYSTNQKQKVDQQRGQTSKDISLRGITLSFGSLTVLKDAYIRLTYGTKYALIGRNGIGKTTLLRCMANNLIPQWTIIRTYLVKQEYEDTGMSALEMVKNSDLDHQALLNEIEKEENGEDEEEAQDADLNRLTELYNQLEVFEESSMEKRAVEVLESLKFTSEMMHRPFKDLSGGWKMKAQLACAVFAQPHLLLLDEPTNHLDLKSIQWLVEYLKSLECTVIVVSHDHDFLDNYAECIIHLTQRQLRYYPGNYSDFKENRGNRLSEQSNSDRKMKLAKKKGDTKKVKKLEAPKMIKMAKKTAFDAGWVWGGEVLMQGVEGEDDKRITLHFPEPDFSVSDPLVQLCKAGISFDGKCLWSGVDLTILRSSRIAILGRNGLGKSTLLKCIAGTEKLTQGVVKKHHNLKVAFFTQHIVDSIDLSQTPVELLMSEFKELNIQSTRDYLGSFGISGNLALQRLGVLSGGQKVRFTLAYLMFPHPHILLLDEPTSHLDIEMTEALMAAISEFQGAIVLISHHAYFLRHLSCDFYVLRRKKLEPIDSLEDFLAQ